MTDDHYQRLKRSNKPLRVLVCGSRDWMYRDEIFNALYHWHSKWGISLVIHGAARGADSIAGSVAADLFIPVHTYPADWDTHGKAAGPIRNSHMLEQGKPDLVLAFTFDLSASRGTADMVRKAKAAGILVYVLPRDKERMVSE